MCVFLFFQIIFLDSPATGAYYDPEDIATKVLPQVCVTLIDPEQSVQAQALKTSAQFMKIMEKFVKEVRVLLFLATICPFPHLSSFLFSQQGPREGATAEETQQTGKINQSTLDSWASWKTLSSFTSWGSSSSTAPPPSAPDASKVAAPTQSQQSPRKAQPVSKMPSTTDEDSEPSNSGSRELHPAPSKTASSSGKGMTLSGAKATRVTSSNGWGDDLDDLMAEETHRQPAKTDGWGAIDGEDDDGSWAAPAARQAPRPAAPKSAVSSFAAPVKDDDDEWAPLEKRETEEEKRARVEEARRKQQERKEQRLKARAATGTGKQGND